MRISASGSDSGGGGGEAAAGRHEAGRHRSNALLIASIPFSAPPASIAFSEAERNFGAVLEGVCGDVGTLAFAVDDFDAVRDFLVSWEMARTDRAPTTTMKNIEKIKSNDKQITHNRKTKNMRDRSSAIHLWSRSVGEHFVTCTQ